MAIKFALVCSFLLVHDPHSTATCLQPKEKWDAVGECVPLCTKISLSGPYSRSSEKGGKRKEFTVFFLTQFLWIYF